jgi:hypothetical protein
MSDFPPPGGYPPPPPAPPVPPPASGAPAPGWWQASDGQWYPPHTHPSYNVGYQPYGQPQTTGTNGLAVASLVLGILWIWWIGSVLAVIFGHVALSQIGKNNQGGRGLAIAGLVLGYIGISVFVLAVIILAADPDLVSELENG